MGGIAIAAGGLASLAYGSVMIWAGAAGLAHQWSWFWGIAAVVLMFSTRITIPLMIGAYIYATDVWDWPALGAIVFVLPGLLFLIPGIVALFIDHLHGRPRSTG